MTERLSALEARQRIMQIDEMLTNKIGMLIEYLGKQCPTASVLELKKTWGLVSSVSAMISPEQVAREVGGAAYPFFVKFKPYIDNKDIDELLKYDFKTEIMPGTDPKTRDMIIGIIDSVRSFYLEAPSATQDTLWNFVVALTKMAMLRAKTTEWLVD